MRIMMALLALGLTACSTTSNVTVMNQDGAVMRGSYTATLVGGTFKVCRGELICTGAYNIEDSPSANLYFPVFCNNGLKGHVSAIMQSYGSGYGKVLFNDGTKLNFVYGQIATSLISPH